MRCNPGLLSFTAACMVFTATCGAQTLPLATSPTSPEFQLEPATRLAEPETATRHTAGASQIRIVRLSQVKGAVELDRNTGQKFEVAFANLPIIAGEHLRTQQGLAEVEFEDNSSLRLTTDSQLDFPVLERTSTGATSTTVSLLRGTLYVSTAAGKTPSDFVVHAGGHTIALAPASHLRLDIDATTAKLAVFQGSASVTGESGSVLVGKHKALTFDTASQGAPAFIRIGETNFFDEWDRNAVDYHKARASAALVGSPYSYGSNDLAYYGSFSDVGGCGNLWRPYLATSAFDPYSSGVWAYYPGSGYSWVSPYPWAWTPYHSGSWEYCPASNGWGWRPQGNWNGLQNHPSHLPIRGSGHPRPYAPQPPAAGQPTLVGVNMKALHPSNPGAADSFVFHSDSAGLGVPRGVFGSLGKLSQTAAQRGSVTTSISETQAQHLLASHSATGLQSQSQSQSPNSGVTAGSRSAGNQSSASRSGVSASSTGSAHASASSYSAASSSFASPSSVPASMPANSAPTGPTGGAHH